MRIMFAYSARNSIAKPPEPYSTLNPETSSDSPSAKSKGERLVSARHVISHIINRIGNAKTNPYSATHFNPMPLLIIKGVNKIIAILTS